VDEITAPVTIRRKKKPQRVDQGGHLEHQDVEGPAHRQHRDARAVDAHRREVAQEHDRAVVLIEQDLVMVRGQGSAGKTEAVTASAAIEAASAARRAVRAHRHAALGLRVGLAWALSDRHQKWRYRHI
jgi:hypothetical protein